MGTASECAFAACGFTGSALVVGIIVTEKEIVAGACNVAEREHDADDASHELGRRNVPLSSFWLESKLTRGKTVGKIINNSCLIKPLIPIFIAYFRKLISISGDKLFLCLYITDK